MAAMNYTQFSTMNQLRGNPNPQNSFTFTAPTQCTTLGTPRPCIQTMSPINLTAPGVGASWQHSIPNTMPWVDVKPAVQANTVGSTTFFTGLPCNVMPTVQPPTEELPRASKRKAVFEPQDIPLSKIHVCADQLANMRISPQNQASNSSLGINSYGFCHATEVTDQPQNQIEQWERFRELESRLAVDCEEKFETSTSGISIQVETGVRVSVAEGVLDMGQNSPILPRSVMESINKPCMQLVLWQSPEKLIRDVSNEECNASDATQTSCHDQADSNTSETSTASSVNYSKGPYTMDTLGGAQQSNLPIFATSSNRQDSNSCHNFSSSSFLRPSASTDTHAPFSQTQTSGLTFGTSVSSQLRRNGYMNLNNFNNNNELTANNNAMDMFDNIDDDMQL